MEEQDQPQNYFDEIPETPAPFKIGYIPPISPEFSEEHLRYLKDTITDDLYPQLEYILLNAKLTSRAKLALLQIAREFTSIETVLTNLTEQDRKERLLRFRLVIKIARLNLRGIDLTPEVFLLISQLEEHYTFKLTRSKGGFERIQQQSMHSNSNTSINDGRIQEQSGINRLINRFRS